MSKYKARGFAITPTWVSLTVGLLGGFGSAMLTQLLASRREAAARSYEHRNDAYVNFITKFYECWGTLEEQKFLGWPQGDPPEEYFQPLYDLLMPVRIFGTTRAANLARRALHSLTTGIEWDKIEGVIDDLMHRYAAICRFQVAGEK